MTETTLLCILDMDYRRRVRKSALANNPTQASTAEKERRGGGEAYGDQCFSNYETSFSFRDSSGHQRGNDEKCFPDGMLFLKIFQSQNLHCKWNILKEFIPRKVKARNAKSVPA